MAKAIRVVAVMLVVSVVRPGAVALVDVVAGRRPARVALGLEVVDDHAEVACVATQGPSGLNALASGSRASRKGAELSRIREAPTSSTFCGL